MNIEFYKGDTLELYINVPEEIKNFQSIFTVKELPTDEDNKAIIQIIKNNNSNEFVIEVDANLTKQLKPITYYYDVQIIYQNKVKTIAAGKIRVIQDVTHRTY